MAAYTLQYTYYLNSAPFWVVNSLSYFRRFLAKIAKRIQTTLNAILKQGHIPFEFVRGMESIVHRVLLKLANFLFFAHVFSDWKAARYFLPKLNFWS